MNNVSHKSLNCWNKFSCDVNKLNLSASADKKPETERNVLSPRKHPVVNLNISFYSQRNIPFCKTQEIKQNYVDAEILHLHRRKFYFSFVLFPVFWWGTAASIYLIALVENWLTGSLHSLFNENIENIKILKILK